MSVPVLRLERRDDLEIVPAATTRSPDSPEFGLTLLHQYLILNYSPPTQGMRARSGWQTVLPSSTGKYTFHPPDGQMEVCVRSVYSEYAEIEELASDPSTSRTVIVAGMIPFMYIYFTVCPAFTDWHFQPTFSGVSFVDLSRL